MTNQQHDIIVFGDPGEWLTKNKRALENRFPNALFVRKGNWRAEINRTDAPIALIMTPPHTHKEICETLMEKGGFQKIYCEKPFPDIDEIFDGPDEKDEQADFHKKISVVDHYLFKHAKVNFTDFDITLEKDNAWRLAQHYLIRWCFPPVSYSSIMSRSHARLTQLPSYAATYVWNLFFRIITLITGWTPVKYIEIDIREDKPETRDWMKAGDRYDGVLNDLGHHALAIMLRMFGARQLKAITDEDITLIKTKYFNENIKDALSQISFLIRLRHCTVRINVAKSVLHTSKKISLYRNFMTHSKPNQTYSLRQGNGSEEKNGYDYAENFDRRASCLNYDEVCIINQICKRVVTLVKDEKKNKQNTDLDPMALINNLTDQFKHRHGFYWQYYYKLVIYQVIILLTPYAFALNFGKDTTKTTSGPSVTIFIVTLCISFWLYFWGIQRITAVLAGEHIRMKVVHDRLKELLQQTKINLSVTSIDDKFISDAMLSQYRFLIRGLCLVNPWVIYFMFSKHIDCMFLEHIEPLFHKISAFLNAI